MGQRGEDLQDLPGLALLLLPGQVAQRPHVVQPVGELDDQHADVAGHRDDHFPDGLGLGRLAVSTLSSLVTPSTSGDVLAELAAQLGQRVGTLGAIAGDARAAKATVKALTSPRLRRGAFRAIRRRAVYSDAPPPDESLMMELRRRFKPEVVALSEYLDRDLVALWGYDELG